MFTLRSLAIVLTGAGVFAGLPLTNAQACDNDRFPCPVVSEAPPQETIAEPAPAAQPRKKAEHPSRQAAPKRADTVAKPAPSAQPPKKAAKHLAPPNESSGKGRTRRATRSHRRQSKSTCRPRAGGRSYRAGTFDVPECGSRGASSVTC